ncbi:MAG: glycosyltransferase [Acidobacteriota bacterium]|nr:glycosyltransferase [Acidobacteriota bacterium]
MKFALISESLPPSTSGQSMVLYRLLGGLDARDYCLVSNLRHDVPTRNAFTQRLPTNYYHLPRPRQLTRGSRYGLKHLREGLNFPLIVGQWGRRIAGIVRREKCKAIVTCTGEVALMPAGYLAARLTGVPFYAYLFDHYSYREWANPAARFWARRLERTLLRTAAGVIAPNELVRDDLRRRHGVEAEVIHNSFDISDYESALFPPTATANSDVKIVYTGDIYEAHYDAFRSLLAALELLGRKDVKLHLYTARSLEELAAANISGPIVCHNHHVLSEMPRIQQQADLLFLPLAFNSPYPDLVRTAAPAKMGEYLATRRPVLVHAPPDSFPAWYFREHRCGVVVDRTNPAALAEAIEQVLNDKELQHELGARAWERARTDFSIATARAKFIELLERGSG